MGLQRGCRFSGSRFVAMLGGGGAVFLFLAACNRTAPTATLASAPAQSQPAVIATKHVEAPAGANEWTREAAINKLLEGVDDPNRLTEAKWAALRLLEIDQVDALVAPEAISEEHFAQLRVWRLTPQWLALGLAANTSPSELRAAIFFCADGKIAQPTVGVEEELALLIRAADHEVFPHVLLLPHRVVVLSDAPTPALTLADNSGVRLRFEPNDGAPFIAACALDPADPHEIARYTWDPYEMRFYGPAKERFAPDADKTYSLNLAASPLLVPRGGVVESPVKRPEPASKPADEPEIVRPPVDGVPL